MRWLRDELRITLPMWAWLVFVWGLIGIGAVGPLLGCLIGEFR